MSNQAQQLRTLRDSLVDARFVFTSESFSNAARMVIELSDQLDDYVLVRLERRDAPLLLVFGGSTGAGKSTIVNSVLGEDVTVPGVLRPTTRKPVLACHPTDVEWFNSGGVLGELPRYYSNSSDPARSRSQGSQVEAAEKTLEHSDSSLGIEIRTTLSIEQGIAILDSPDIDSIEVQNHDLASQLLGAADLWLFATTAARYADAVPWQYLKRAQQRSMALALVINRIPPGASGEIRDHFNEMMLDHGLVAEHVFTVEEGELIDGRIGPTVDPIRQWISELGGSADARRTLIDRTLDGALRSIPQRVDAICAAQNAQRALADELRSGVTDRYAQHLGDLERELNSGNILAGEVMARFHEIVGTGEFMGKLQQTIGRIRDRITSAFSGTSQNERAAIGEIESNIVALVRSISDTAARDVSSWWTDRMNNNDPFEAEILAFSRSSSDLVARADREVEEWQSEVLELVRKEAGSKVAVARTLSVGINGVGLALMVAVFSHTGGLTGGEAVVAGGTAALSQTILSAVFGEAAIRTLVATARESLHVRMTRLFDEEAKRFVDLLTVVPSKTLVDELMELAAPCNRGLESFDS